MFALTAAAMLAFAGNSLLCRIALKETDIDPATFTAIRLASGALALWLLARRRGGGAGVARVAGSWGSALALFVYAAAFSFAYLSLTAATGALLLFGAVQATMIGGALIAGERMGPLQLTGLVCACSGLVYLLAPGLSAPPPGGAALMIGAGVAWGVYSLRGRAVGDPTRVTAGNFIRALPFALGLSFVMLSRSSADAVGAFYAVVSGALTSGVGYAIWYSAVRQLRSTSAATVQLSVPVITAIGGVLLLGEEVTSRLAIASLAVLGGIALTIGARRKA